MIEAYVASLPERAREFALAIRDGEAVRKRRWAGGLTSTEEGAIRSAIAEIERNFPSDGRAEKK